MPAGVFNTMRDPATAADWRADDLRLALAAPGYGFAPDHATLADVGAVLLADAPRLPLAGRRCDPADTDGDGHADTVCCRADDAVWEAAAFGTVGGVFVYREADDDDARRLVAWCPLQAPATPTGGAFTLHFAPEGVFTVG